MGRVIAVANQKGGVGKTTTAINLASSFAACEVNTLLVDCDPQSNATSGLGLVKDPERLNTYHLLVGATSAEEAVEATALEQLLLISAHKNLIGANLELVEAERRGIFFVGWPGRAHPPPPVFVSRFSPRPALSS